MFGSFPVIHSGVGGEAVRGCGEEGPPQRGVPLPPLHGLRPCGGVQEDAASETIIINEHIAQSECRDTLRLMRRMFLSRLEWHCIKSCPRIRTISGLS